MLLRGVREPPRQLDNSDLAILKSKARHSGRDFGGAPLYDNTRQHPQDRSGNGRGSRISYAADRPPPGMAPPGAENRNNPFAAFLDPKYAPVSGMPPPPPQHYGNGAGNGYRGPPSTGSLGASYGNGYGNAPPREQGFGYGEEEGLKVNMAAMPMVRMAEETSTMMAILVEEEEAKINTRIVVAPSAIATIKVKVKGMAAGVEATTTTTKATAEDRVHQDKAPTSAKPWGVQPDMLTFR